MKLREFLHELHRPDVLYPVLYGKLKIENMPANEFEELLKDMQAYVDDEANTWAKDLSHAEVKDYSCSDAGCERPAFVNH